LFFVVRRHPENAISFFLVSLGVWYFVANTKISFFFSLFHRQPDPWTFLRQRLWNNHNQVLDYQSKQISHKNEHGSEKKGTAINCNWIAAGQVKLQLLGLQITSVFGKWSW